MKTVCSLILFVFFVKNSEAQKYHLPGAKSNSMGGISTSLSSSWSVFGNQAGLANQENIEAGIYYSRFFVLRELELNAAFVSFPVQKNVFALSFYQFGGEFYKENKFGLVYSKEVAPGFSAGFQFNYFNIYLAENESRPGFFSFEGGIQYRISKSLLMGVHVFNPFQSGLETESITYKLPSLFKLGCGLFISKNLDLYFELEKDLENLVSAKAGMQYSITNKLQLSAGIAGEPNTMAFGISYLLSHLKTDFAYFYNSHLGGTPSISISYSVR